MGNLIDITGGSITTGNLTGRSVKVAGGAMLLGDVTSSGTTKYPTYSLVSRLGTYQYVTDELRITSANYNATTKVLTVTADSGAFLSAATPLTQTPTQGCSTPCLTLDSYGLPAATATGLPDSVPA